MNTDLKKDILIITTIKHLENGVSLVKICESSEFK